MRKNIGVEIKAGRSVYTIAGLKYPNWEKAPIIRLGTKTEELKTILEEKPYKLLDGYCYETVDDLWLNKIEVLLTHESLHFSISKMIGWDEDKLDNIDENDEISSYNL